MYGESYLFSASRGTVFAFCILLTPRQPQPSLEVEKKKKKSKEDRTAYRNDRSHPKQNAIPRRGTIFFFRRVSFYLYISIIRVTLFFSLVPSVIRKLCSTDFRKVRRVPLF